MPDSRPRVGIVGVHIKSDAYPNVKYKVQGLLADNGLHADEFNFPPGATGSFADTRQAGLLAKVRAAISFGYGHLLALRAALRLGASSTLYIPYPAVFLLFLLSLFPQRWRPGTIHADAFISLYDTIVNDRALLAPGHWLARLLKALERRAYRSANVIWVDTDLNADYTAALFDLPGARFAALPLSINEAAYASAEYTPPLLAGTTPCTVLFIGTFVPLQGVDVIAEAIVLLRDQPRLRFRIIGDGQCAAGMAAILAAGGCTNVHWERAWQSAPALAEEIRRADICLGIFGGGDKAQRVWPYKNYAYMAVGRALITADTPAARAMATAETAWEMVPPQRADLLAARIVVLAQAPARRMRLARAATRYYRRWLSNARSSAQLARRLGARPQE